MRLLLEDPPRAQAMGVAARERVRERFLGPHSLLDYLALLDRVLAESAVAVGGAASS